MSDCESDTYWSSITKKIINEQALSKQDVLDLVDKLASISFEAFKLNFSFCSNISLIVIFKLIENIHKNNLTKDEYSGVDYSLGLVLRNLVFCRNSELDQNYQALSLSQFLNLVRSLLACEPLLSINDIQFSIESIKNTSRPQFIAELITPTSINTLISDFFNYEIKIESKSDSLHEFFSKIVLKHIHYNNFFDVILNEFEKSLIYLNVYRKNHLKQFNSENYRTMTSEEAFQTRAKYF